MEITQEKVEMLRNMSEVVRRTFDEAAQRGDDTEYWRGAMNMLDVVMASLEITPEQELVNAIVKTVGDEYERLYRSRDRVDGFIEALDAGEEFIRNGKMGGVSLKSICRKRGDIFCSDREVAALGYALKAHGIL